MTQESDCCVGALTADVVSQLELDRLLAVYGEVNFVGNAYDFNADSGVAGDDDRADGEQVRTDRGDQHRVDVRHDDGPVGGKVVGRGAGGGGDDDAVGAEGGDGLLVYLDGEVAHAGDGSFGYDDVVEASHCLTSRPSRMISARIMLRTSISAQLSHQASRVV